MRLTIVVNDVLTEMPRATTTILAHAAARLGHVVHMIGLDQLTYYEDGRIGGMAHIAPAKSRTKETFIKALRADDAAREQITTDDMDVLWLRYNPAEEVEHERYWGQHAGVMFGRLALTRGVIVLNHPDTLAFALDKFYFQHFPAEIRPLSLITRELTEIERFYESCNRRIVVKPLNGYGGTDVFLVERDARNLHQMVESVMDSGYVLAQEYLPASKKGDTRLFMFNGEPLIVDGAVAAVNRVSESEDFRANMTAGARPRKAKITDRMLELASIVGPKLKRDGIFCAGLDVVGDKLVEINTISSGGLNAASRLEKKDFASAVIRLIERKVEIRRQFGGDISNIELATMR